MHTGVTKALHLLGDPGTLTAPWVRAFIQHTEKIIHETEPKEMEIYFAAANVNVMEVCKIVSTTAWPYRLFVCERPLLEQEALLLALKFDVIICEQEDPLAHRLLAEALSRGEPYYSVSVMQSVIDWLAVHKHRRSNHMKLRLHPLPEKLTAIDVQLLEGILNGKSNRDLEDELHYSASAIDRRLEKLFEILQVTERNRVSLVRACFVNQWII